jgi:hypothetical protein
VREAWLLKTNPRLLEARCPTGKGGGIDNSCKWKKGSSVPLTPEEINAIDSWWSGDEDNGYDAINGALRQGKSHPMVTHLDSVIEKAEPTTEDTLVYRGLSIPEGSYVEQNLKKGYSFQDDGFVAVTGNKSIAEQFAIGGDFDNKSFVMAIKIPAGTKMANIEGSGLDERLLPRSTGAFKIDSVKKKGNVRYVEARYIRPS